MLEKNNPNEDAPAKTVEEQLAETKAELEKLKGKDISFSKLKSDTEAEKAALAAEKEELAKKVTKLEGDLTSLTAAQRTDWKSSMLGGLDEAKRKEVEAEYAVLNMPEGSREEINTRMAKAMKLAGIERRGDLSSIAFASGSDTKPATKSFMDTDKGKELYKSVFGK